MKFPKNWKRLKWWNKVLAIIIGVIIINEVKRQIKVQEKAENGSLSIWDLI